MRAGPLRERVTIQQATVTQDVTGDPVETWANYITRWAQVDPINGTEKWATTERLAEVSHRFRMRYDSKTKAITPEMRVSWQSRVFDIKSVTNTGTRDTEIIVLAVEKV